MFKGKVLKKLGLSIGSGILSVGLLVGMVVLDLPFGGTKNAQAVTIFDDNQFVLDFVANGDGSTGINNQPVAVYWQWDGGDTLGIRMETPTGTAGFGNFWSFNVFSGGVLGSPGGLDSNGSNNTVNVISASQAFTATSLGAFGGAVDAIEGTWTQPSDGGTGGVLDGTDPLFDPSLTAVYVELTMSGPSGPSDGYRINDYRTAGTPGAYSNPPDFFVAAGICGQTFGVTTFFGECGTR